MILFLYTLKLGDLLSPGLLASPHAKYEGLGHCVRCHELLGGVPDGRCLACHREIRRSLARPLGYHSRARGPCRQCHPDHRGRDFKLIQWDEKAFSHDRETTYPLGGRHAGVPCKKCHRSHSVPRYSGLRRDCAGCHRDVHRGRWGEQCEGCHREQDWKPVQGYWARAGFDHEKTRFLLMGRHAKVPCQDCHRPAKREGYRDTPRNCAGCHRDIHRPSWGIDCQRCHGVEGWRPQADYWKPPGFDHARFAYPLEGRHRQVACASCHLAGRWKGLAHKRCDDCHSDQHQAQFPGRDCRECHALSAWQPSTFRHPEGSGGKGYRLDPLHRAVGCEKCHPLLEEPAQSSKLEAQSEERSASFQRQAKLKDNPDLQLISIKTKGARYRPLETTCRGCHRESDQFYRGRYAGLPLPPLPEAKSEAVECQACHDPSRRRESRGKEALLQEAQEGCIRCHNASYGRLFLRWQEILQEKGAQLEARIERLRQQVAATPADHRLRQLYGEMDRAWRRLERERYHNLLLANAIYDYYLEGGTTEDGRLLSR